MIVYMKTTIQCPVCDVTFTRIHTASKPPRYCSRACANKAPGRMTPDIRSRVGRVGPEQTKFKGGWIGRGSRGREYFVAWVPLKERDGRHPTLRADGYMMRSHYVWNTTYPTDPVQQGEMVHHINHDTLDDRPANLRKASNQKEHAAHHRWGHVRNRDPKTGRFLLGN